MQRAERIDRVDLMRTLVRIVEAGSLSAAARQLNTTQATVSRRLQSLETDARGQTGSSYHPCDEAQPTMASAAINMRDVSLIPGLRWKMN